MLFWHNQSQSGQGIQFSVVDVETTGLFPERSDRIIEIAIVRVDSSGRFLDQFTSLVNPNRDLGPTHIHRISADEIQGAPPFAEVAGDILTRLAGTVFAGYYPHFDFRFLQAEVKRLGHDIPPVGVLCVNEVARDVAPDLPGRKLEICCNHFGVPLSDAHSAHADAVATAKLLHECFRKTNLNPTTLLGHLDIKPFPPASSIWPGIKANGRTYTRTNAALATKAEPSYIAKLVASLPSVTKADGDLDRYYALLDRILEDRIVTQEETARLLSLALDTGLCQERAIEVHHAYMRDLVLAALADGFISEKEEEDLRRVCRLLSIHDKAFEDILLQVRYRALNRPALSILPNTNERDIAGLSVCFTGGFTCHINGNLAARDFAEAAAREKGMQIRKTVTKDLDILVAADPHSMSSKAQKARRYNIRIVAEPVFWHWMDIDVG
jgi:DNA polymerase III subunit epsilon